MNKGHLVMIYEDPITKKKPEGKARLIEKLGKTRGREYWRVRFLSDYFVADRWIEKEV